MARNTLSKLDIVNLCLAKTGKATVSTLEGQKTGVVYEASLYYDFHYQQLLALFPWPFATRQELLQKDTRSPHKYRFAYKYPDSALYMWEISSSKRGFTAYGDTYDVSRIYRRYILSALSEGSYPFGDGLGEIIDGRVESDYFQLYMFYTYTDPIPVSSFTPQFVNLMVSAIDKDLLANSSASVERLQLAEAQHQNMMSKDLASASIENRRAIRIPRAKTLQVLDSLPRF